VFVAVEVAGTGVLVGVLVEQPQNAGVLLPLSYQALTIEHVGFASHAAAIDGYP
jgi:hypothetical protein